jgi:hypothetical protein
VARSVPHDVVPRVGDSLKKQQREIFGYNFLGEKGKPQFSFPFRHYARNENESFVLKIQSCLAMAIAILK